MVINSGCVGMVVMSIGIVPWMSICSFEAITLIPRASNAPLYLLLVMQFSVLYLRSCKLPPGRTIQTSWMCNRWKNIDVWLGDAIIFLRKGGDKMSTEENKALMRRWFEFSSKEGFNLAIVVDMRNPGSQKYSCSCWPLTLIGRLQWRSPLLHMTLTSGQGHQELPLPWLSASAMTMRYLSSLILLRESIYPKSSTIKYRPFQ